MSRVFYLCVGLVLGSLWGFYGPISVTLPATSYAWSDGYGSDGCGMCPWHDSPEETRQLEDKQKNNDDRCGAEGKPDSDQNNPGIY